MSVEYEIDGTEYVESYSNIARAILRWNALVSMHVNARIIK